MNQNWHLLLVINPKSGSSNKSEVVQKLTNSIDEKDWTYHLYETTGIDDGDAILKLIQSKPTDRIIIAGGDGTINLVAHALKDISIDFGVIPTGSANGLALNLELPDSLDEQIKVALGESLMKIDHLNVNGESCLHIADMGLNAELIHNFEDANIRGKLGYLLQTIPTLLHTKGPLKFKIEIDGKVNERTGILLAIANAKKYGTGANINPNGNMDDRKFEILIFKELDTIEILKTLFNKVDLSKDFAECFHAEKVIITTETSVPFQIDGEPMDKVDKVEVSLYPNKLSFAVPWNRNKKDK